MPAAPACGAATASASASCRGGTSDGPAAKIALPDIGDLKKIKPNVAFQVPPSIANLLRGDMTKLKDGEGSTSGTRHRLALQLLDPGHHALRLHRAQHLPVAVQPDLPAGWLWIKICIPIPETEVIARMSGPILT